MGCTVSELEDRITVDEMDQMIRYAQENGGICPHRRLERVVRESAALICLTMASINAPKGKRYKLQDFMPKEVEKDIHPTDEITAVENLLKSISGPSTCSKSIGNSGIKWRRKASARG